MSLLVPGPQGITALLTLGQERGLCFQSPNYTYATHLSHTFC